jgi:DNA-binding XRE family transcriptional regulator
MTAQEFRTWRMRMRYTQGEAATALGLSRASVQMYEAGHRRGDTSKPAVIPRTVALACGALAHGILEYRAA